MDEFGRKTLGEITVSVWRWLSALRADMVDPTNGEESPVVEIDELYSKPTVLNAINQAVTKYAVDLTLADETALADEELIDIRENVVEYPLPFDLYSLKACWWKSDEETLSTQPPSDRTFMWNMETVDPGQLDAIENGAPRYKRRMNYIVLDRAPDRNIDGGIKVEYVKWLLQLQQDDQYIETQYSQLLQECVILAAAKNLSGVIGGVQYSALMTELKEFETRLTAAARAAIMPPRMQMVPASHPFVRGKRRGLRRGLR